MPLLGRGGHETTGGKVGEKERMKEKRGGRRGGSFFLGGGNGVTLSKVILGHLLVHRLRSSSLPGRLLATKVTGEPSRVEFTFQLPGEKKTNPINVQSKQIPHANLSFFREKKKKSSNNNNKNKGGIKRRDACEICAWL